MGRIILLVALVFSFYVATAQQTGFAPSEGVNIHYRIYGSGELLLVINGGPGFSSEGFTGLAEKYRVILYDQRGTGKSRMETVNNGNMTIWI